jgi:hypothetical protein
VIKSRIMRWVGYVAGVGKRRGIYKVLVGKPGEREHLEDPGVDEMDFQEVGCGVWTG